MTTTAHVVVPERGVDVEIEVPSGATVGLLGPNGAGKSTVLAALAGTLRPEEGRVVVGDDVVLDAASGRWVAPHDRHVGLLAQEPLLFPHLDVLDNVAFGPRSSGASRAAARERALAQLRDLGCDDLAHRSPGTLSGGQAARVALARALAADPRLLLLDEPLAALDAAAVPDLRATLRRCLEGRDAVLVTHDVVDALLVTDLLVVIEDGRVVESGPTREVLDTPRSTFAAELAGLTLLRGRVTADGLVTDDGLQVHAATPAGSVEGSPAVAVVDPATVALHLVPVTGSPRNVWAAHVLSVEPHGRRAVVRTTVASADVTLDAVADLGLVPGSAVHLAVKAGEITILPL